METFNLGLVDYLPAWESMRAFTAERSGQTSDQLWLCEHSPVFTQGLAGKAAHVLDAGNIPVVATDRGGQVTFHGPGQVMAYPLIDLRRRGYFVKEYVYRLEEALVRTLAHFGVTGHRVAGAPGIYVRLDDPFSHARLPVPPATANSSRHPERVIASPALRAAAVIAGSIRNPSPAGSEVAGATWIADRVRNDKTSSATGSSSPAQAPSLAQTSSVSMSPDLFAGLGKIAALGIKVSRHCTYHGVALNVAMELEPFSRINPCGYAGLKTVDLSTIGVSVAWDEAAQVLGQKLGVHLSP